MPVFPSHRNQSNWFSIWGQRWHLLGEVLTHSTPQLGITHLVLTQNFRKNISYLLILIKFLSLINRKPWVLIRLNSLIIRLQVKFADDPLLELSQLINIQFEANGKSIRFLLYLFSKLTRMTVYSFCVTNVLWLLHSI